MAENDALNQQIYHRMNQKETVELLDIWQKNNRAEWSEETFVVIHAILLQRLERVPEQTLTSIDDAVETEPDEAFRAPQTLTRIATWADTLAWPILVLSLLLFALRLVIEFGQLVQGTSGFSGQSFVPSILLSFFGALYSLLLGAFYFVVLQAISAGINHFIDTDEQE